MMDTGDKNKKKTILFLVPSLYGGGAERVCCLLASHMAEDCHVIVAYLFEKEFCYPLDARCETVLIPQGDYRLPIWRVLRLREAIRFVRKLKEDRQV